MASAIVLFYIRKIKDGTITIDDVPKRWKQQVIDEMERQEEDK